MTRRRRADDDDDDLATGLQRNDSGRGQQSYRSLLHENMSLLDKLRQQEDLCRALESQMGDIDSKMDNVADQHLRTLGEAEGKGMCFISSVAVPRLSWPLHHMVVLTHLL